LRVVLTLFLAGVALTFFGGLEGLAYLNVSTAFESTAFDAKDRVFSVVLFLGISFMCLAGLAVAMGGIASIWSDEEVSPS